MSYRSNKNQQISLFDSSTMLTERERKALDKSWAKLFSDEIFPAIDEDRFSVLYSKTASRPNTPVNVIVGALIIKELFDLSDDEVVENLMLDIHYQYALHTTSFEEQPLSDKTLSRFRKRCYDYEQEYGIDLFHDCICDLNEKIAKLMGINSHIKRMDSMMIEANIRNLSRIELLYSCVSRLVKYIHKDNADFDLFGLEHYYDPDDKNFVIYHSRKTDVDSRINIIISDADKLIARCKGIYEETTEYRLLLRCLEEQTVVENSTRRLRTKNQELPKPTSLQNPTDPDATFRSKAGKKHIGYIANVIEAVDSNGSIVTDYQYEQNVYSDNHFLSDYIEKIGYQEESLTIVADGAYSGQEIRDRAADSNIEIVNTALSGTPVDNFFADFEMDDTGEVLLCCPAKKIPSRCKYFPTTGQVKAYFEYDKCFNCSHKESCPVKLRNRTHLLVISRSAIERARQQSKMETESFKNWRRIRNGVESIPSILRNYYNVDKIPVRGRIQSKFFFGSKISALNFKKLLRQRRGLFRCTQNPILA